MWCRRSPEVKPRPILTEQQEVKQSEFEYALVFRLDEKDPYTGFCPRLSCGADSPITPDFDLNLGDKIIEEESRAWLILKALLEAGLEIYPFITKRTGRHLLFVLVTCGHQIINTFADDKNYQVALDPVEVGRLLRFGNSSRHWRGRVIAEDDGLPEWGPYDHIYAKWEHKLVTSPMTVYRGLRWEGPDAAQRRTKDMVIFEKHGLHRLNLLNMLIRASKSAKGAGLQINSLLQMKILDAYFPIHNQKAAALLLSACLKWSRPPWRQPLEKLKEYFGTQIALWFVFMGHYSWALLTPAILGLGCQLVVWATGPNFSSPVLPPFGAFISLWSIAMLAYWKRQETKRALMWGTSDFEETETQRPEFEGIIIRSFIDGKLTLHFPENSQAKRLRFSASVIATLIIMVVGAVTGIYVMKFVLTKPLGSNASTLASVVNTIQINVFNYIYSNVARLLVENENIRTETEFSDSLISKLFMFQFVNSYASFFYIAFIAAYLPPNPGANPNYLGQCGYYDCMQPLALNLGVLFGTSITVNNVISLLSTLYAHRSRVKTETKGLGQGTHLSGPEMEYSQLPFNNLNEVMKVYADVTIQFGFSVLFVTALPVSCLCSLLSNFATVKMQLWKMLRVSQRPLPIAAEDIGPWFGILHLLAVFAVMTNAGLICFTMDVLGTDEEVKQRIGSAAAALVKNEFRAGFSPTGRLWVFVCFIVVLLLLQFFVHLIVPPESDEVNLQKKRQELIREKLIEGVADDDWDDATSAYDQIPDMNEVLPRPGFFSSFDLTACFRTSDALGDYVTIGAHLGSDGGYTEKLRAAKIAVAKSYDDEVRIPVMKLSKDTLGFEDILDLKKKPTRTSDDPTAECLTKDSSAQFAPVEALLDAGAGFVVGARVEGEFGGDRWFPGTILRVNPPLNNSSEATFDVDFDDKGIRKAWEKVRDIEHEKLYADASYRLSPSTAEEFECQVFYRALRCGRPGLDFIMFNRKYGADLKRINGDQNIVDAITDRLKYAEELVSASSPDPASTLTEEYKLNSQLLFAEIFSMCCFRDAFQLRLTGGFDQFSTCLQLFYCARSDAMERRRAQDLALKEMWKTRGCFSDSSFNALDGLREMLSNAYIVESWRMKEDALDCYNSVVNLTNNLALVCALVLIIAIPKSLAKNGITEYSTFAKIAYLFCISVVSLTEGLAVLITTRNLIALHTLEPENIKAYLSVAKSVLLMPIRLNFVAVVALIASLNFWMYSQNGVYIWLGFFLIICVPCIYIFLASASAGIKCLFEVQPWRTRKFHADDLDAVLRPSSAPPDSSLHLLPSVKNRTASTQT